MLNPSLEKHKTLITLIGLFIIPLSGLAIDVYVPSLPAVSHYFHTSPTLAQLSITSYMVGMGLSQLVAGAISDTFGRRLPALLALFAFIITTAVITFSSSIHLLIALRLIQGISMAVFIVPVRSLLPDLFEGKKLFQMMTYMTTAWSIGPVIAPAIGGYLQEFFGWKATFYFLLGYGIIAFLLAYFYLPETSKHRHAFHLFSILTRYKQMLMHTAFRGYVISDGLLYSPIIIFSVIGPFIIQTILHYSPSQFGHIALCIGAAWFFGTLTNRALMQIPPEVKAQYGLWIAFIAAIAMCLASLIVGTTLLAMVIPMLFIAWMGGIIFPNNFASAVSLFRANTGSANALFGSTVYVISAISSAIGSQLQLHSSLPFTIANIVILALCLAIFYLERIQLVI